MKKDFSIYSVHHTVDNTPCVIISHHPIKKNIVEIAYNSNANTINNKIVREWISTKNLH